MKCKQILAAPVGPAILTLTIILDRYLPNSTGTYDFLIGFMYGLSLVLNITYIIIKAKYLRDKSKQ